MIMDELRSEFSFFDKDNEVHKNAGPFTSDRSINDDADSSSTIDENLEIESVASSVENRLSCRGRLQVVIHSLPVQLFVLTLVVLDTLIVLVELLLDLGAFGNKKCSESRNVTEQADFCHYNTEFRFNCSPSPTSLNLGENLTSGNGTDYCVCAYRAAIYTCVEVKYGHGIDPARVLHKFSVLILSTFMVEVLLKLIAFRLKYFTHKFEVFDGLVVIISWILDIASVVREEALFQLGGLIIILRLWVSFIVGGVLAAKAQADDQLHKARLKVKEVVHALHKAQDLAAIQSDDLEDYTKLLEHNAIDVPPRRKLQELPSLVPEYPYDKEEGIKFNPAQ